MTGLLRSKFVMGTSALFLIAAAALSFTFLVVNRTHAAPAHTAASNPNIDCNGVAPGEHLSRFYPACADFTTVENGKLDRGEDNGVYVGHDEPAVQFNSTVAGSGNNLQWNVTLPVERPLPATQSVENYITFWFDMAICDPRSFPFGACTPDSDSNNPNVAGSALLELQLYPPDMVNGPSCTETTWCAAMNIDSLSLNNGCFEPVNFAFLQTNGVPSGPPAPGNFSSDLPNAQTLEMNQGDRLVVTVKDTPSGLLNQITDLSTGQTGFMVASAANGFADVDPNTCTDIPFNFHPEYSTASFNNIVPWTALEANVGVAYEIGHFETFPGDEDGDDPPCFPAQAGVNLIGGCFTEAEGGDLDFDGTSYQTDWPNGSPNNPVSALLSGPHFLFNGLYAGSYPSVQIETDVAASESSCNFDTGAGCVVPPPGAAFYPYYSVSLQGKSCTFLFGNNTVGVNSLGQDAQYGSPTARFPGTLSSGERSNPCFIP
jgi:hypothetical protein